VDAARPCRHRVAGHWFVDETYVKVSGSWRYVCRAVNQDGQVIDVFFSKKRDLGAATHFFTSVLSAHGQPAKITTDRAHTLVRVVSELLPGALHDTTQYANNRVEADHGRLKARLRPMRGLKRDRTATIVIEGHAFIQNRQRGHYELGVDARPGLTQAAAFDELALVAPVMFAEVIFAPIRLAEVKSVPTEVAQDRLAPERSVYPSLALLRLTPTNSVPLRAVRVQAEPARVSRRRWPALN
jgi:hypothetical protein